MHFLSLGAAAVGIAALSGTLHEGAGQHLAQGAQSADQAAAKLQFRVRGQSLSLPIINVGRKTPSSEFLEICKDAHRPRTGSISLPFGLIRQGLNCGLRNRGETRLTGWLGLER